MAERLLLPPPFEFGSRQLGSTWKTWKRRFEVYLAASENDLASDKKKTSLLLHALGEDGIVTYESFDFVLKENQIEPTFEEVIAKFDDFCLPRVNVTFERHLFFTRDQKESESVESYVAALRKLAKTCEFGELRESLVRDRFICGLANVTVKEKLLAVSGITLEQAIDKSRAAGLVKEQIRVIEQSDEERVAAVQKSRSRDQQDPRSQKSDVGSSSDQSLGK